MNWDFEMKDPGFFTLPETGRIFRGWRKGGHGKVNMHKAFLVSSNTYFLSLAYQANITELSNHLSNLGFGQKVCLDCFDEDRQVIIFSDDPNWCYKQKLFSSDRFIITKSDSPYHDLHLMTQCDDFIIANSTFSWWGAWLCKNPFKDVVYPHKWFGPHNSNKSTVDLFPKTWRIMDEK